MNSRTKLFLSIVAIISLSVAIVFVAQQGFAWTNPGSNPPMASPAIRVSGSNVGIGMTPSYPLDVSGDARISGTLQGGSVPWARLNSFPSACTSGQYVTGVGGTLTCATPSATVPWGNITSFPSACPAGQFASAIGGTLTCSTPPGGSVTWSAITSFPAACPAGQFITTLAGTPTCVAPATDNATYAP